MSERTVSDRRQPAGSTPQADRRSSASPLRRRVVGCIALGTLLNPLNSSMIAVSLVRLHRDFDVGIATTEWLVSGFYLAAAVGQPLMGRLADQFGARRVFCAGLGIVALTGALAPLAPTFGWLIACRVLQALGTSAAYPAGLLMIRGATTAAPNAPPARRALGVLAVANSVSAGVGPVLGGFLVSLASWPAIFLVNVAIVAVEWPMARRWLPRDITPAAGARRDSRPSRWTAISAALSRLDLPGIALFSLALAALFDLLLSLSGHVRWPLLVVVAAAGALFVGRERRARQPFLDVRMLVGNRPLMGVYVQFALVNVAFYGVFFGVPLWLEQVRGFDPGQAGLLMLPIAGCGVGASRVALRLITRAGPRIALIIGAATLTIAGLALLGLDARTPVVDILLIGAVLGVPNGFNNLSLQAALYEHAPAPEAGAAAGLFQTFRYIGAILATSMLGLVFPLSATTHGLHVIAVAIAAIGAVLVVASVRRVA